jgi:hypothetical protein
MCTARCWWLIRVIPVIQEVEIRRISARSQPRKQFARPYLKKKNPPQERAGGENQGVGSEFKLQYHKKKLVQL